MSEARGAGANVLYTVGHSNTPAEDLAEKLAARQVVLLVDVRRYPSSRRNPQFNGPTLARFLESRGVRYVHEVDLGGHRDPIADSRHTGLEPAFQAYADHLATPRFRAALERILNAARRGATAVMCAEAAPEHCHRRLLADAATVLGFEVRHILSPVETRPHELHPLARRDGDDLSYPAREKPQLRLF